MILPVDYRTLTAYKRKQVRDAYVINQLGRCYHCSEPLNGSPSKEVLNKKLNLRLFPIGFLKHPVHLHHDHKTGMTIGAVHSRCNGVLWQYHGE